MDAGQTTSYIDDDGKKKTGVVAPSYNKDTDYAKYMQRAAADGDMGAASYYEQQRNKKIAGEGMDYSPSNLYAQYAKQYTQDEMNRLESGYTPSYNVGTDYASMTEKAAKNGDYAAAAYYEQQRNKKIAGEGITQYKPEYIYQKYAKDYDDAQKAELERGYQTAAERAQGTGYLESALNELQNRGQQGTEYDAALKELQGQRWQGTEYDDALKELQGKKWDGSAYDDALKALQGQRWQGTEYDDALKVLQGKKWDGSAYDAALKELQGQRWQGTEYDDALKELQGKKWDGSAYDDALKALQGQRWQGTEYDDALKELQGQKWQGTEYDEVLAALQDQLQQQLAANETESAKQTELALMKIQQQKEEATKKYDSTDRQLYLDMMNGQKALPEQLARAGYTGGASESSLLKNRLTYEQALRENESGRADALTALDIAGNEAALQQQIAKSQADRQARSDYMSSYSSAKLAKAQAEQQAGSDYMSQYLSLMAQKAQAGQQANSDYLSKYLGLLTSKAQAEQQAGSDYMSQYLSLMGQKAQAGQQANSDYLSKYLGLLTSKAQAEQQAGSDYMSQYLSLMAQKAQAGQQANSDYLSKYIGLLTSKAQANQQERNNYLSNYLNIMSGMQSQKNYDQEQSQTRWQKQASYAQAAADIMAKYGDFSGYAKVTDGDGNRLYSDEQIAAMKAEYDALKAASTSAKSSGGGGGYSYSDYSYTPAETQEETEETQDWTSGDFAAKLAEAQQSGWTNKQLREQIDQAKKDGLISRDSAIRLKYQYRD